MKLSITNMFLLTILSILLIVGPAIAKHHKGCTECPNDKEGTKECWDSDTIWECKNGCWSMVDICPAHLTCDHEGFNDRCLG